MGMNALGCGNCGAGLPPPDASGRSCCVYCGTEHRERSSEVHVFSTPISLALPSSDVVFSAHPSWHEGEDAARIPMTEEAVLRLIRRHFGDAASVFVCPHVPPKQEQAARRAHAPHLPERERILALYEASWSSSGEEGFVVTARRLCWKNARGRARSVQWRDLDPERLFVDIGRIFIGDEAIEIGEDGIVDACGDAFHVLALSGFPPRPIASSRAPARDTAWRSTASRPPPHASYHTYASAAEAQEPDCWCWHCHAPLLVSTPQCAQCGALPDRSTGWLRTA